MIQTEELTTYENYNLNNLSNLLEDKYEIAKGKTYSIAEIRKAVSHQQPAFVRVGKGLTGQTVFIVGENEKSLVAQKDNELFELPDKELKKSWTGEAVIVLEKKEPTLLKADEMKADESLPVQDYIIYPFERDTWEPHHVECKEMGKSNISKVNNLELYLLPSHPIIVIFKKPSDDFKKKGIRAANNGVEIQIYDTSDPLTEFLHELGHVYWNTQLTDEEKMEWHALQKKLTKEGLPSIFLAEWDWHDWEEVFCTIYLWCIKGELIHNGYTEILKQQYLEGYELLQKVFNRVKMDMESAAMTKANKSSRKFTWKENEKDISIWLNNLLGRPSTNYIKGKGLIKSYLPTPIILPYDFPESIDHTVLSTHLGREWVRINSGLLKGRVLILKDKCLAVKYMESNGKLDKVPIQKTTEHNGKRYNRTVYKSYKLIMDTEHAMPSEKVKHKKSITPFQRLIKLFRG